MKVLPFEEVDCRDVFRIHQETFGQMNLERYLWQVCQQIESLEKDSVKLVCKDERVKGYAAIYPVEENSFRLNLLVDPQQAKQGIGTALLREIEIQARNNGARQLEARIIEGMNESLTFALSKGFIEIHRMRGVSLRAEDFSFENWRDLGEKLTAEGFMATTFEAEERAGAKPLEKLVELQKHATEGWFLTGSSDEPDVSDAQLRQNFSYITVPETVSIMKHGENTSLTRARNERICLEQRRTRNIEDAASLLI